ncbi:MAG TPA: Fic family protein [Pyrinomonadaceae bacterium]
MRAGKYIKQAAGFKAFIPAPLPPAPPISIDAELTRLLSEADRSLGRLDGISSVLPNPDLFVAMYVRQEAVLSSQIEGTQSSLEDVLQFEVDAKGADVPKDVEEVVNYVRAMNFGIQRLEKLPLSLRLIREIHSELLKGTRGAHRTPGEFRRTQNWIGSGGASLSTATFVPPPVPEMKEALNKFEKFLHDDSLPVLIHTALAHAQFETIHPFLDGNGRVGRLLITFLLCERKVLHRPLLYLSHYLKMHRAEYYDRLMAIRNDGNWEAWLKFFLRGVGEVSQEAIETARRIFALRDEHRQAINRDLGSNASGAFSLLDYLYEQPIISVRLVEQHLKSSFVTANKLVEQFIKLGILNETTGRQRNRRYAYGPYLDLFETSPNQS